MQSNKCQLAIAFRMAIWRSSQALTCYGQSQQSCYNKPINHSSPAQTLGILAHWRIIRFDLRWFHPKSLVGDSPMKILLIEDDAAIASAILQTLSEHHYLVDRADDGQTGLDLAETGNYALILLDVVMPGIDGISLCRRFRAQGYQLPILLLTARNSAGDRVLGLDAGADDYLVKPFDFAELLARIRSLLRRQRTTLPPVITWGDLQFDPGAGEVSYQGVGLRLTPKEYALLELFLTNPHRVFSRSAILDRLWAMGESPGEETVTSHIKTLRQRLKSAGVATNLIETVHGLGYRLRSLPDSNPTPSPSPRSESPPALPPQKRSLDQLRQKFRGSFVRQVDFLEQVAIAAHQNQLTPDLHHHAQQEVHKLIGSFGTFGYPHSSRVAQEIDQLLQSHPPAPSLSAQLMPLVALLRQDLEGNLAAADSLAAIAPPPNAGMRVLVVDDDAAVLAFVQGLLEPWGVEAIGLANPQGFETMMTTHLPDLVILDVEMPTINGIQLCQLIRSHEQWTELPILVLSAHTDMETRRQVFTAGADDYVQKPIVEPELLTRVINRLEQVKMQRQLADLFNQTGYLVDTQAKGGL
ncbi:MAG: response regulator [Leptolyngbyaceae cyanobacterium SL_7_1]|nr:response regulator [Leptolyngbyaceae cyanobacterium SL_7_1]